VNQYSKCPICQSKRVTTFLKRERVPVHQNLIIPHQQTAMEVPRGNLTLVVCETCGFIYNDSFEADKLSYGDAYDNTQTCSTVFEEYVAQLVQYLIDEKGVHNSRIVEVGCGKGLFLRKLVEAKGSGNIGYGFDPSYVGSLVNLDGRLRFEKRYYDSACSNLPADAVVCRHVIEHVPDPLSLLKAVRQALGNSPNAQVFFETPCLEWILKNQVFWDFFYEHCSYFTKQSLLAAFGMAGFQVESIRKVFRDQYLWIEARLSNKQSYDIRESSGRIPILARQFADREGLLIQHWQKRLKEFFSLGRIAIWGAGGKGVTFANLVDPHCKWIDCVVDLNPGKQGGYVPGTGHPIVSYQDLPKRNVATAILMNSNYREENQVLLQKAGIKLNLVDQDKNEIDD